MTEYQTIIKHIEHKTYLKGKLRGKYIGYLDYGTSDLIHENYFSLEILEAKIIIEEEDIRKKDLGVEFEDFRFVEHFPNKLPPNTLFQINYNNDTSRVFALDLKEPKVVDIRLFDQVHEKEKVFGTIEGSICGYILQTEHVEVKVPITIIEPGPEKSETPNGDNTIGRPDFEPSPTPKISFWEAIIDVFQILLLLLFISTVIFIGWPFLLVIGFFLAFQALGTVIRPVLQHTGKFIVSLFWILFLIFGFVTIAAYFSKNGQMVLSSPKPETLPIETTNTEIVEENGMLDSVICHYRVWKDYSGTQYKGYLKIKRKDWQLSQSSHQATTLDVGTVSSFNQLLKGFISSDTNRLYGVYSLFDSIKFNSKLNDKNFAEAIVSCIQDIPYTLILDGACDPYIYNDQFVYDYLSKGGTCHPYVKYGIFSPVEFVATLDGDCDTRALLLYTILSHYGYDVAMLSSAIYKHAVIAIYMPYIGTTKTIEGKQYVIWETTQSGIPPGVFPNEYSNMSFWSVNLISTKSNLQ